MKVTVLYFAVLVDHTKTPREVLELQEGTSIAELRAHIQERYPSLLGNMGQVRFAQNEVFAPDAAVIQSGDTIALIPPVAGG
jgi:molybdopterin converting factor subunit 1